jgi:hypothetical protein
MRDFYVILAEDYCATNSKAEHDATLWNISKYFGQVLPSGAIADVWLGHSTENAEQASAALGREMEAPA